MQPHHQRGFSNKCSYKPPKKIDGPNSMTSNCPREKKPLAATLATTGYEEHGGQ